MSSDLLEWFKSEDGALDTSSIGFTEFPGQGLGAVALKDVPVRSMLTVAAFVQLNPRRKAMFSLQSRVVSLCQRVRPLFRPVWARRHGHSSGWTRVGRALFYV